MRFIFPHIFTADLSSSSVCRIPLNILYSGGLMVINCFTFCLSLNVFISPSIMNDSFALQNNLVWQLLSFSAWNTFFHVLLGFKDSFEKSTVILMSLPLSVTCQSSVRAFNILSLLGTLNALTLIYLGVDLFWSYLLGVLITSCFWMAVSFSRFGESSPYFFEYAFYPFSLHLFSLFYVHDS
jgi:hypothetical protein